ncbi:hypothetical protein BDF19DRAFT_313944 [Syncephalis fuscata]|nr:hypothetical protein BDF19DRAFT_313944 [Syncephalis fuscata]
MEVEPTPTGVGPGSDAPNPSGQNNGNSPILGGISVPEPNSKAIHNDLAIVVPLAKAQQSAATPTTSFVDPGPTNNTNSETDNSKGGGTNTPILISITVSMVVLAVLGVAMVLYVRRRREMQQLLTARRLQTRASSNIHGNNVLRSPPLRASSLVRRNPSPIRSPSHITALNTTNNQANQSPMTITSTPFSVTTSQGGADAWGIPPQIPANWPAHVPRPVNSSTPIAPIPTSDQFHNTSGLQLEAQTSRQLSRETSVKRSHSIRNRIDRTNTLGVRSDYSNENEMWESSSIWSEDDPEQVRPPRQSLANFRNPATAAAAMGVVYQHDQSGNTSWQTQLTTAGNTMQFIEEDDSQSFHGSYAFSDDDGPLSDKLNELMSAEQQTRTRRSVLNTSNTRGNTSLGSALIATLSPPSPIRSSALPDALVLGQATASTTANDNSDLIGILNVSRDIQRDSSPQTSLDTPKYSNYAAAEAATAAATVASASAPTSSNMLQQRRSSMGLMTTKTIANEPVLVMPRPQSVSSFDAQRLMEQLAIEEANQNNGIGLRENNTVRDSVMTLATTMSYESSRPTSDAYFMSGSEGSMPRGLTVARRINLATASVSMVDVDSSYANQTTTDLQSVAMHIPLPATPQIYPNDTHNNDDIDDINNNDSKVKDGNHQHHQ